jgi:hypothetical protein
MGVLVRHIRNSGVEEATEQPKQMSLF